MKKLALFVVAALLAQYAWQNSGFDKRTSIAQVDSDGAALSTQFERRHSNEQVRGQGEVLKILADDIDGSRHQRFILRLDTGQTLLIAHNIDLAPPIPSLSSGDLVEFFGEYEWNSKGGVVHWTHHDPRGAHVDGWLKHDGKTYK